jgi:hypothetical protein
MNDDIVVHCLVATLMTWHLFHCQKGILGFGGVLTWVGHGATCHMSSLPLIDLVLGGRLCGIGALFGWCK